MQATPKAIRLHIGIFGRRNAGKSSLLNALTRQQVSIVSAMAGTTTDPVEKQMELLPIGPVLFIDTAGIDDEGAVGTLRVQQTRKVFERTDLAVLVLDGSRWGSFEDDLLNQFATRKIPVIVVFNKHDLGAAAPETVTRLQEAGCRTVSVSAQTGAGIPDLIEAFVQSVPEEFITPSSLLGDLIRPGELVVLVVPIDKEAPKGRLILPQAQTIRDLLDNNAISLVVQDTGLVSALERLKQPPALVVTDSQAFRKVADETPANIPITSFSILFARYKGDLDEFVRGAAAIESLKPGDRVLIAEACSHHPIGEDIGRVKIPSWLTRRVGEGLEFVHVQGRDFPEDLSPYRLVIHCGACVWNRRSMLSRILHCRRSGVPITNYGVAIAHLLGILERAVAPFTLCRR